MPDLLLLLTKTYPYDSGEEFLENEILTLSETFKTVVIVATAVNDCERVTRKVPENVLSFPIKGIGNSTRRYLRFIPKGLGRYRSDEVTREIKSFGAASSKLACLYFAGRCNWLADEIVKNETLAKMLKDCGDAVFYSYWFSDLPYLAVLLKRRLNSSHIRIVSRAHGYDLYEERNPGGHIPFRKTVFEEIKKVYACSKNGEQYLSERYPVYKDKIGQSYLGTTDHGAAEEKHGALFHIATCSSIIPLKRLDRVVDALAELESRSVFLEWTCIGDGPLLEKLREEAGQKLKRSTVNFMGRLPNEEVLKLYKSSGIDAFLNTSETEGLPVSIMEAISFGIPAIATDVGGTGEIVRDGVTGLLVKKDVSAAELADAIETAMKGSWDRSAIRDFWNERFNAAVNYRAFAKDITD